MKYDPGRGKKAIAAWTDEGERERGGERRREREGGIDGGRERGERERESESER